jgi:hypothetical protein
MLEHEPLAINDLYTALRRTSSEEKRLLSYGLKQAQLKDFTGRSGAQFIAAAAPAAWRCSTGDAVDPQTAQGVAGTKIRCPVPVRFRPPAPISNT